MLRRPDPSETEAKKARSGKVHYPQPMLAASARQWLAVCLLLFAASIALASPWLSGIYTIPWDAKGHFQAQAAFLAQSIHSGQNPFWAPYVFGGHPQIADPQSLIFSPPYLLLALLTPDPTMTMVDATAFATLVFGALGVIGFARDRQWHPAAALVAALAFAFGGAAAWRIQHIGQIMSLAYFPWALWMLDRGLRLSSIRYGALAGFFAAMTVLGPDQVSFLGLIVLAGFTLSRWFDGPGALTRMRASLRPLGAGAIVGLVIITIPMLMVLSFADGSNRAHISLDDANYGSLHPTNLLTFVVANLYGTIGRGAEFWGAPSQHWPYIVYSWLSRNMVNVYMGLLPVLGLVMALATRAGWTRRTWLFSAMFLVMTAYAMGRYTPVFAAFYHLVPGTDLFRRPADATFLVGALGALLGGYGLDALLRRSPEPLPRRFLIGLAIMLGFFFVGSLVMAIWLGKVGKSWPDMLYALVTVGVSLAALAYAMRRARSRPMQVTALLALCLTADLAWNIRPNHSTALPTRDFEYLRPDTKEPLVAFLREHIVQEGQRRDRIELVGIGFEWPNTPLIHRFEASLGYNPLRIGFYGEATGARDHVAGWDQRKFGALMPGYRSPFAQLLGLRYIVSEVPIETIDVKEAANPLPLLARIGKFRIYENKDTLPRVMVVPEAQSLDQAKLVTSGHWPSTDFRNIAFVEPSALPLPHGGKGGTARIAHYENTRVEVEVDAPDGGLLVLNDVFHPWWFATVDGMPTRILRTNGVFRSVVLPRGAKKVVFTFEPMRGLARHYLVRRGIITN